MSSRSAARQATCTYQIISINNALLHLWRKENFPNHQKDLKYHAHDCRLFQLCKI